MRKVNYFGNSLPKIRLNGFLMAGLLGGATNLNATPGTPTPTRKRENTLAGTKQTESVSEPKKTEESTK